MKKEKTKVNKEQRNYDKGQVFVKVMAGILALLMVSGTVVTLVFALMR